jgi:phosphoglycolate phosphatase
MTLFYPQAVFFDLDGTLVDSAPDLTTAVNRSLADLGRPPITEAQARAWIGNGARRLVARALAGQREIDAEPAQTEAAMAAFFHHYQDTLVQASRVYDGVVEGLTQLAALARPMGVVTNKPGAFTAPLLEALGLEGFFAVQVSGDTLAVKKPDPAPLLHAAAQLGVAAGQSLYVGDSAADRDAARAAGMPMVRVPYGYPGDEAVFANHPAAMTLRVDALAARLAALGAMHDAV